MKKFEYLRLSYSVVQPCKKEEEKSGSVAITDWKLEELGYQRKTLGMSYKTRMGNRMENSGLKIIYLDIMVKDRFVTQIPYPHCTLFPIDSEELKNFVLEKRPSLKNKDFRIEFSNNKVK